MPKLRVTWPMDDFPKDITARKIKRFADAAGFKLLQFRAIQNAVLAIGFMKIIEPARGVVISAGNFKGQKEYDAQVVAEPGLVIEIRLQGHSQSQEVDAPRRRTVMSPGDLLISGKKGPSVWDVHAEAQGEFTAISIRYTPAFLDELAENSPEISIWALDYVAQNSHCITSQTVELTSIGQQILHCSRNRGPNTNLLLQSLALQTLALIWKRFEPTDTLPLEGGETDDVIAFVLDEIEQNPSVSLTVKAMATACRMSESSIKQRFKKATGRSIGGFIVEMRMRRAAEMLNRGVSVKAASQTLGYSSTEAFSKAVKTYFGRSPRRL